jgi:N,N'-diacetyllegionaminate synthase
MTGLLRADGRALIVAEIGNNHEGDPGVALDLVRRAAECGVDAVKFQTFRTEQFVRPADAARFERLKRFELSPDDFARLAAAARRDGLLFISTPLDLDSARMLEPIVDAFKIASGDITCSPLIECVGQSGKSVVLSTGASEVSEVQQAIAILRQSWERIGATPALAVLHCVSCYPTPPNEASLRAIAFLREQLGVPVGYSDHTMGIDAAVVAVAVGACIVEKHFTLDKQYSDFRDHQLSADVPEMKALVERVRAVEDMLGAPDKRPQPCEGPMREAIRRSIVAASDLPAGHLLGNDDFSWMRPATGVAPGNESQLVGRRLKRPLSRGDMLTRADVD